MAVALLALVGISIYRYVDTALYAARVSANADQEHSLVTAFSRYLRMQMQALPAGRPGAITGEAHRFNRISCDELSWIAGPGSSLLTRHANGEWLVTLTARNLNGGEYELGLRRQDIERRHDPKWLPLFRRVMGFEVRYFDPARREWMEKWADSDTRPSLVKVRLWREDSEDPLEWILPVPVKNQPNGGPS